MFSTVAPKSISPLDMDRSDAPSVAGLYNLGNTCYMNAVLQVCAALLLYAHVCTKKPGLRDLSVATSMLSYTPFLGLGCGVGAS